MKGMSFAKARELQQMFANGTIIRPDQAKASELDSYKAEWNNIWNLRDQFLSSALNGGAPVEIATLEKAELLALETMRRRITDIAELSRATGAEISVGTRFVASVLGVELPERLDPAQAPATDAPVVNLHG